MTVDQRPHAGNPPRAGLVLPATLTRTWRELPRCGWVLARAFSPRRGNTVLAAVVWLPWTGQLMAARCYHGAAVWAGQGTRAVAILHASPRQRATVMIGALGGIAALAAAVLAGALTYLHVVAVSSLAGAAPIWLAVTLLYAAAGATAWSTRHTLSQHHPQTPGVVRIGTLAAWPTGHGAGLHHLGRHLCALADTHQVTLDLVARTPHLIDRYTRIGFTQPEPGRPRLVHRPAGLLGAPRTPGA